MRLVNLKMLLREHGLFIWLDVAVLTGLLTWLQSSSREAQLPDALAADPEHWHLEFENAFVRVTRSRVGAHEKEKMHNHELPAVVVYLTEQDIQRTLPDGTTSRVHIDAGVRWVEPAAHEVVNLSDKPFELVRVDLKMIPH